jgi:PhoPQ-activated pathogenicity-related protein
MAQNAVVLFKFDVPEIAHLGQDERQRILTQCWDSAAVQEAWKLYWNRPQQIPFIPLFIIVPLCVLAHMSFGVTLLISLPVVFVGFYFVKRHYKRQLVALIRQTASDHL